MNGKTVGVLVKLIQKACNALNRKLIQTVRFGKVVLIKDGKTQKLQIKTLGGDVIDNAAFLEPYGLTAKPRKEGSLSLVLTVAGEATNTVVLTIHNRELRFKGLKEGEVCLYDEFDNYVHLQKDGNLAINTPNKLSGKCKTLDLTAEVANINAAAVNLGGTDGVPVARLGDEVSVDPNTHKGTITSASLSVRAK